MTARINSILIVDDTPKNLQVLGNTLKNKNYKVEFAINGLQALDWLDKKEFDLVLLDVMMPEMDGYEVCVKVRANEKLKHVPIIFLTAKTDTESVVKGFEIGAQDYITKPFNTSELLVRVHTQLELKSKTEELKLLNESLEDEVRKKTVKLQQSYQELEKANGELLSLDKAKSDFISIITRELRVPLDGITGILYLLKDKVDSKEITSLINELNSGVNNLEKFSSYALLLTALKTGKQKLNKKETALDEVVEFTIVKVAQKLKENQVMVNNNIPDMTKINVDPDLINTAFVGMFEDAIVKNILGKEINISTSIDSEVLQIKIQGSGEIFPEHNLKNEADGINESVSLFGLGFNIANLIFRAHNGMLNLSNESNKPTICIKLE